MLDFLLPPGLIGGNPPYWFAVVVGSVRPPAGYDGVPRPGDPDARTWVLVLEPAGEHDAFVSRYDAAFGFQGDEYFGTREAAIAAAEEEFGESLGTWQPVPESETDAEAFALRAASGAPGE